MPGEVIDPTSAVGDVALCTRASKPPLEVWVIPSELKLLLWQTRDVGLESLQESGLDRVVAETDVHKGAYEGGFKLWECSVDVTRYIHSAKGLLKPGLRLLDLGCGHGVPGVFMLQQGLVQSVLFQDLNGTLDRFFLT